MNPTRDAAQLADRVGREERPSRASTHHVGGQEAEARAAERRAVLAAVARVAAAALEPQQLGGAFVELVVADRVEVEPDLVHRLDRRLVVEERRQQRAGADEVAGRDHERVRVAAAEHPDVRGQELGAARGYAVAAAAASARPMLPVVVGSRCPWKSLIPSSWTFTAVGCLRAVAGAAAASATTSTADSSRINRRSRPSRAARRRRPRTSRRCRGRPPRPGRR